MCGNYHKRVVRNKSENDSLNLGKDLYVFSFTQRIHVIRSLKKAPLKSTPYKLPISTEQTTRVNIKMTSEERLSLIFNLYLSFIYHYKNNKGMRGTLILT